MNVTIEKPGTSVKTHENAPSKDSSCLEINRDIDTEFLQNLLGIDLLDERLTHSPAHENVNSDTERIKSIKHCTANKTRVKSKNNVSFRALQKWEGFVTEVGSDTFWARLIALKGDAPDQEAEFYLEDIDTEDRSMLKPGAVFYWSIGYQDTPSGRSRHDDFRFQRLPVWTKNQLLEIEDETERLKKLFHDS